MRCGPASLPSASAALLTTSPCWLRCLPGLCRHRHGVVMERRSNAKGAWVSHWLADEERWCRGK